MRSLSRMLMSALLCAAAVVACQTNGWPSGPDGGDGNGGGGGGGGNGGTAVILVVTPDAASIAVGGSTQLSAIAADADGHPVTSCPDEWESSTPSVATVSGNGTVSGVAVGMTEIVARCGEIADTATLEVTSPGTVRTGWYASPGGRSSNAGTAASPWDLATALDGAGGRVQPGDTIWLRGGTYPDGGELTVGGTATAPVVVSGYPGETAVIQRQFAGTASYVVITRLVFEGPIDGATNQVYLHGNHHVVFTRNEIRFGDFHAGLSVDESHHYTITHNYIHDNGRDASHDHGIYFKTTTGPGTVIAHNLLVGNAARGLSLHDNSGVGVFDVVVAHNTVVGNGSTGILVNDGDRNTLVNNVVVGNGDATGQAQIRVLAGDANRVWSNLTWHATASGRRGIENTTGSAVSGNVVADPRFRSATDLRLQTGSPAIDAGLTGWTIDGTDYTGKARDAKPDLGAYEQ